MEVHVKEKPFACPVCSKSFSANVNVRRHIDTVHNGVKPHQCYQCSQSFSKKSNLSRHIKSVHVCLMIDKEKLSIESEIGLSGRNKNELTVKQEPEDIGDMNYDFCKETYAQHTTDSKSCERITEENDVSAQSVKVEYLLEQSSACYDGKSSELSTEEDEYTNELQQDNSKSCCNAVLANQSTDENSYHVKEIIQEDGLDQLNQYVKCNKSFCDLRDLRQAHKSEEQHLCSPCNESFNSEEQLTHHIQCIHSGNKQFSCDKCDSHSTDCNALNLHVSDIPEAHSLKKYKCSLCDSYFSQKSHLTRHIRSAHAQEKSYECSACEMKFSQGYDRDAHWRSVHPGVKRYSCDLCDYRCTQSGNLAKHRKSVHFGIKSFSCEECDYKSEVKRNVTRHWKTVHCNEELYVCFECSKTFTQQPGLKTHIDAVHRGLKPYSCEDCDSTFAEKSALKKHVKAVHLQEKPYSCPVCSKRFSQMIHVRIHVDAVHNGNKRFQCTQCSQSFSKKCNLERHIKSLHS